MERLSPTPLLVYDGDCGFCAWTVRYARRVTQDAVEYAPYQEVGGRWPELSTDDFARSIRYFGPDGTRLAGAAAAFRTLAHVRGRGLWWWAYRHVPGVARLAERAYDWVARRRPACHAVGRALFGAELEPTRFALVSALYLRALGLIYLSAFWSLGVQVQGLVGSEGILPVGEFLTLAEEALGSRSYHLAPTLFWLWSGDVALDLACLLGAVAGVALIFGTAQRTALLVAWALYLSLVVVGQEFLSYQWDYLLLEMGFLGLFVVRGDALGGWLMRLLAFRFMLLSGLVKLLSGDPTWADYTALYHYFETQPLPSPLAWHANALPSTVLRALAAATLFVEVVLPFFVFAPRHLRIAAGFAFAAFQLAILATGNHGFFNLEALAISLFMFDDQALRALVPASLEASRVGLRVNAATRLRAVSAAALIVLSLAQVWNVAGRRGLSTFLAAPLHALAPFGVVNGYGPFGAMTTQREEIVLEGTQDGVEWRPYRFRYKPGEPQDAGGWNVPHQPRLDWQLWFAALGDVTGNVWFVRFGVQLLKGSAPVRGLLLEDPFPDDPPIALRARRVLYWYTDPAAYAATGRRWHTEDRGLYMPRLRLRTTDATDEPEG